MRRRAGALTVLGSALFLIAAFSPISNRVFAERSIERRVRFVTGSPVQWLVAHVLFGIGPLLTAGGLLSHAFVGGRRRSPAALRAGAATFAAATVLWTGEVVQRSVDPEGFARRELPAWPFYSSIYGAEAGLALVGLGLKPPEWTGWVRWTVAAVNVVLCALTLILGDMPPFVLYLITLPIGVALHRRRAAG